MIPSRQRVLAAASGAVLIRVVAARLAVGQQEPIDWNKAREPYQRAQRGETLTAVEQAVLYFSVEGVACLEQMRSFGSKARSDLCYPGPERHSQPSRVASIVCLHRAIVRG